MHAFWITALEGGCFPEKHACSTIVYEAGWIPEPFWTWWRI